jgi:transcriptional regulator with XRE-family HTH domain
VRGGSRRLTRDLGRRIAELRASRDLTQEEFSERLRVSLKYIQRIEAGSENLTVDSLYRLAMKLRVPVIALFEPPSTRQVRRGRPPKRTAEG